MVILRRCCCWRNVRSGSFASGIFTLIFYTIILTAGAFHVHTVLDTPGILTMSLAMLICSGSCVISSVLLLIGLCVDSKALLLPWIVSVSATTLLDIFLSLYLVIEAAFTTFLIVLFAIDSTLCALNVYSLLCVVSQYQIYSTQDRRQCQGYGRQEPAVQYQMPLGSSSDPRSSSASTEKLTTNSNLASDSYKLLVPTTGDQRYQQSNELSFISEDMSTTTTSLNDYQRRESTDLPERLRNSEIPNTTINGNGIALVAKPLCEQVKQCEFKKENHPLSKNGS